MVASISTLDRVGKGSLVAFGLLTIFLAVAPFFVHDATKVVAAPLQPPSWSYPLGTDEVGRDVLPRIILGMRVTWFAVFPVIFSGLLIGGLVGAVAGCAGRFADSLLMRFTDVALALPGTLITIALASALGRGLWPTLVAVMVTFWPPYARIMRGEVKRILARPHAEAAEMGGAPRRVILLRHVLPGLTGPMLVQATLDVATVILILAALSFLGFGQEPPAPELGAMSANALPYVFNAWWLAVAPAFGVFLLSLIGNLSGDAVADLAGE